ncbi:MAG TPA: endonuclease/exonuclease/phosphatase family protein [Candidatus Saccharimonadales bacterium]|nr:endonuclease/exonuclease/phosphatase family protein [Candidatus Saccharimonadales bacterium]
MQLSLLQWNVWFEEDIERVLGFLRQHPTDVICLQELTSGYSRQKHANTWEYLARELGYSVHYQAVPVRTPEAEWQQANAILSRFPIVSTASHWIHEPVSVDDQPRSYVEAVLDIGGTPVTVATTHLSFAKQFALTPAKKAEVDRLTALVDATRGPYVLTGDLNDLPDSYCVSELMARLDHAGPPLTQNTWTTKPFIFPDFEATGLDWRLDYVFCKGLKVDDSKIIMTDVSDHLPIAVSLSIQP